MVRGWLTIYIVRNIIVPARDALYFLYKVYGGKILSNKTQIKRIRARA